MNKRAKSSRKRMAQRMKWGRGGVAHGGAAPEAPKSLGRTINDLVKTLFKRNKV